MNRNAEYDSLRDLIAAHQNSEVEPRTASQAPSDAGREGTSPSLPSRPANPEHGDVRSYWNGCRCLPCKKASRKYQREYNVRTGRVGVDKTPDLPVDRYCARCRKPLHGHVVKRFCSGGCLAAFKREEGERSAAEEAARRSSLPWPCDHCNESFRTRKARGAHVASVHPYSKGKASYAPPEEKVTVIHHRSPYFGQVVA